jgi:hypothetical protein
MTRQEITDWRQRTIEAEELSARLSSSDAADPAADEYGYTYEDRRDAEGWNGCAVGEYYRNAPKKVKLILGPPDASGDGLGWSGPKDRVLQRLGGLFSVAVDRNDFLRAYELIDLIEARALELRARRAA